ncbi:hypothetical protein KUTeg_002102 [Tegillarca granosa]|uniref:Sodium/nucleoside cotransporter n=1 Tax=Tegillarca granosa TaxID=220873 RepID=A0ABQ9FW54_TEGGR|nr:hypothetical protein KUTeg_002102 [Tegillarca granosa]
MDRFLRIIVFTVLIVYIIIDVALENPSNLTSVGGMAAYLVIMYLTSTNPSKVIWHPVFWGIVLQYMFALLILRTYWGYEVFTWLGERLAEFLSYADEGAKFVFDKDYYTRHNFAFKIMPIVVYFSTVINVLYYLGVMQFFVKHFGRFLSFCLNTTPAESVNAAANMFVSMTEAPLMIKPFLEDMTDSEFHAVMTGGFATVAGGVPANHLLSASIMSAPAALAISKLTCPETETTIKNKRDFLKMAKPPEKDIIAAASSGATQSIKLVATIVVNVMAFLSLLKFVNSTLAWFGDRIGVANLSFQLICSYALFPVSFFMGTEIPDCRKVAELVGIKTFTNEFIAYDALSTLIHNKERFLNYTSQYNDTEAWKWDGDNMILTYWDNHVLVGGIISDRSTVIATYALCGFSNFGSIGITLGVLSTLAPSKKGVLSKLVMRAMIAGNVACFLTACIAGKRTIIHIHI